MAQYQCVECGEWNLPSPYNDGDYLCFNCCFTNEWIEPKDYPEEYKEYKESELGCDMCGELQHTGEPAFTRFKSKKLGKKWMDNGICYDCIKSMLEDLDQKQYDEIEEFLKSERG